MKKILTLPLVALAAMSLVACGSKSEKKKTEAIIQAGEIAQKIDEMPTAEQLIYKEVNNIKSSKLSLNAGTPNYESQYRDSFDLMEYESEPRYSNSWGNIFGFNEVFNQNVEAMKTKKDGVLEYVYDVDTWTKCLAGNGSKNRAKVHMDSNNDLVTMYYLTDDGDNFLEKIETYTNENSNTVIEWAMLDYNNESYKKYIKYVENESAVFYEIGMLAMFDLSTDKLDYTYIYDMSADKKSGQEGYKLDIVKEDDNGYYNVYHANYVSAQVDTYSYSKFDSNRMLVLKSDRWTARDILDVSIKLSYFNGIDAAKFYYNDIPFTTDSIMQILYGDNRKTITINSETTDTSSIETEFYIKKEKELTNPMTKDIIGIYGLLHITTTSQLEESLPEGISLKDNYKNMVLDSIASVDTNFEATGYTTLSKDKYNNIFTTYVLNNYNLSASLYDSLRAEKY